MASAYPHTMILFHILSQKNFSIAGSADGTKNRPSGVSHIKMLFQSLLVPLLTYSNDTTKLTEFQLIYSFDFGLRTNLFPIAGVDPDFFIADTIRRLNVAMPTISSILRSKRSPTPSASISGLLANSMKACAEFSGQPANRGFYFNEVFESPFYGNMIFLAFQGLGSPV